MSSHDSNPYDTSWTGKKSVNLRDYTNLYVNSKVEDPIGDSIKLGYTSDLEDIVLTKDAFTYFHFPMKDVGSASNKYLDIKNTTIISDGATYGSCPYKADRIYKLRYNYEDSSPYGRAQDERLSNGTWLCTWLSGDVLNPEIEPKWMDRWFDPKKADEAAAEGEENKEYGVYDVESEMSFDYGAYYKYWRVGEKTIQDIASSISVGDCLKLHLTDWKNDNDHGQINYLNPTETSFYNYRVSNDFDDDDYAVTFNGKNQLIVVPFDNEKRKMTQDEYSICFWVKCNDWENCTSYSIVDNLYVGGWKFGITNRSKNSFIFTFGNDENNPLQDGTMGLYNNMGQLVSTKAFWKARDNTHLLDMLVDIDLYSYILDCDGTKAKIYKVDYNGNLLGEIEISANLQYLDLGNDENGYYLYAYGRTNGTAGAWKCYKINRYDMTYVTCGISEETIVPIVKIEKQHFVYDRRSVWVAENGDDTNDGFNFGDAETDKNLKYYRYSESSDTISIAVDYNNVAYVLKKDLVEVWKVVSHHYRKTFEFKIKAGINPTMIDIVNRNILDKNVDHLLILSEDKQCIYVYGTNGEYVDEYDTSRFYVRPKNKRKLTMYDYYRMNKDSTNCVYFDLFGKDGHNVITKPLSEVSNFDWHQMAAIVKRIGGNKYEISFYFDCIEAGKKKIDGFISNIGGANLQSTKYYYDSPIIIGGRCGKLFSLMQEINVCNKSFSGSIDDFRIYDRAITQEDLYYIYMSKFACDDLSWHYRTDVRNLVEDIERFYKFKMPGSKSAQYVLHINGYKNSNGQIDEKLKSVLEKMINRALKKLTPAYSSLIRIEWD